MEGVSGVELLIVWAAAIGCPWYAWVSWQRGWIRLRGGMNYSRSDDNNGFIVSIGAMLVGGLAGWWFLLAYYF